MRKFSSVVALATLAAVLAGCGGGGEDSKFTTPTTPPSGDAPPPADSGPKVNTLSLRVSTPTLVSSGATPIEITASARDANNAFMAGKVIGFTASSGGLQVTQATTDANGDAKATLTTASDPSSRTITITATASTVTTSVTVDVTGSQLTVQGPSATVMNQNNAYSITLIDSDGKGIPGKTVTLASARGNTLSAASVVTDTSGQATFAMTVTNAGSETITASALNMTKTFAVSVSNDSFAFTAPALNAEIPLGATETVTLVWKQAGNPVAHQPITFAITRGTLSAETVDTDDNGSASITISATNAGAAVLTASGLGATTQRTVEFVATTAASIVVQPSVFTLGPKEQSTITAVVRDAAGNHVKNKTVMFSLTDVTGGSLTTASAVTDSQGRAQSAYTAADGTSARDGVLVKASVQGSPSVTASVLLTVAQRQVFISLGTGNKLDFTATQYKMPYVVQVTDASGNGVAGVQLALSALSVQYYKGRRAIADDTDTPLVDERMAAPLTPPCPDEDENHNGQLDLMPFEDDNGSGRIEAGNIATVTPRNIVSDANGFANVELIYPQEYAYWLMVSLEARTSVQGTEFVRSAQILLPGLKNDFDGPEAPPGPVSPFGINACNLAN